jgi:hypothetical protein
MPLRWPQVSRYCYDLVVRDYRRGMDWILDLLTTSVDCSELHFTDHWQTQTSVLSLLKVSTSRFLATAYTERNFSAFRAQVPVSQPPVQNSLSTDNSSTCNCVPGWRPFHTNLLVFSSLADFRLTTDNWTVSPPTCFTSLHSTELLKTLPAQIKSKSHCDWRSVNQ